jgi:hypothetical protein
MERPSEWCRIYYHGRPTFQFHHCMEKLNYNPQDFLLPGIILCPARQIQKAMDFNMTSLISRGRYPPITRNSIHAKLVRAYREKTVAYKNTAMNFANHHRPGFLVGTRKDFVGTMDFRCEVLGIIPKKKHCMNAMPGT